jgi:hypothetical protein
MNSRRVVLLAVLLFCSLLSYGVDRQAFTFTTYNLKITLDPAKGGFAANGAIQARNDSGTPQKSLVLQISGTLVWSTVRVGDQEIPWVQQQYTSDIDHSGELSEAILTLPKEVAPGAYVNVSFSYEGTIPLNTGRLLRVNTPGDYAARTDWDRISEDFTAVRGLGYVVWYPVAMNAVMLADGPAVWDAIAAWNQRQRASSLKADFGLPAGQQLASNADSSQVLPDGEVELNYPSLGARAPTFVLGNFTKIDRPAMTIYALPDHIQIARDYVNAAEKVTPEMTDWFGTPKARLVLIELPNQEVLPYDDGSNFYFTPMTQLPEDGIEMMMAHQIVHTIIQSPHPWIQEGLGYLGQLLIREKQAGRDQALLFLHQFNAPLADIEKANLQAGKPQPLATSNDQLLYRAKGAYVWFMLRRLAGDDPLSAAIKHYNAAADTHPRYMQTLIEAQMKPKGNLEAFFDDWVYNDKGLPDFRIDSVYPRNTLGTNYVVTVTVENLGEAGANAIVLVNSAAGERSEHTWMSGKSKTVIRVSYPGVPQKVLVNDGSVPEWNLDNNEYEIKNLPKPSE